MSRATAAKIALLLHVRDTIGIASMNDDDFAALTAVDTWFATVNYRYDPGDKAPPRASVEFEAKPATATAIPAHVTEATAAAVAQEHTERYRDPPTEAADHGENEPELPGIGTETLDTGVPTMRRQRPALSTTAAGRSRNPARGRQSAAGAG